MRYSFFLVLLSLLIMVGTVSADTVLQIYPTVDSSITYNNNNQAWSTLRAGAGTALSKSGDYNYGPSLMAATAPNTDKYNQFGRTVWSFNTSDIPDNAVISNVSFMLGRVGGKNTNLGTPSFGLTGGTLASNTSIAAGDFDGFATTEFITRFSYADVATADLKTVYLNEAGRNYIDKTGFTVFYGRDSWDLDNSFTGTWVTASRSRLLFASVTMATVGYRPYINVTYTEADTTPPASVTNLAAENSTCTEMDVSWTEPADADLNHTMMYMDNVLIINETNTTSAHEFTGLTGGQSYTFSTKTCDTSGNCNAAFVNVTESATSCTTTPVANFTADNTTVCVGGNVQFTDTSENVPTSWHWIISPGGWDSHDQNPISRF